VSDVLTEVGRETLGELILGVADDELILGHRNSEWTGHAPILEEDIAFSNIAQDELGHASLWYDIVGDLTSDKPDDLVFFRSASDYRNVQFVELPKGDWAFTIMRQFLFDTFEILRCTMLQRSNYLPISEAAAKIHPEELYHFRHTSSWITRLGQGTVESNRRTQLALEELWGYANQLFVPMPKEDQIVSAGVWPDLKLLRGDWLEQVIPFLEQSGLKIPSGADLVDAPRKEHSKYFPGLIGELQEVARLDPTANW
jgi:ring-1,2-phenylacetyl-CoA epoxidase subunit PaaC